MTSVDLLRAMLLIRRFEELLQGRADRGFQLFSSGQEAVAVGLCAALNADDQLLCSGRSIGPALARGLDPGEVLAELLGREAGPCAGLGGRGHIAQPERGLFGAHAVVGGNISIAAGVALAFRAQGREGLVVCLFGDGACGAGALHETLNIAAIWRLPLLLVCDNNGYSVASPRTAMLAPKRLADLAQPFGVASETVDGMDVLAVRDAVSRLAGPVRAGHGPALLECLSSRFLAHSTGTRESRSAAELETLRKRCPLQVLASSLRSDDLLDDAGLAGIEHDVARQIAAAVAFAEASPPPSLATALQHVG